LTPCGRPVVHPDLGGHPADLGELRSGDLTVRYDHVTKTVIFDRAVWCSPPSSLDEDRLGESLVRMAGSATTTSGALRGW